MSRRGCLLLVLAASTLITQVQPSTGLADGQSTPTATATPTSMVPTVSIPQSTLITVPTVTIPQATATATATPLPSPKPHKHPRHRRKPATRVVGQWIWAYLTSYCPGSAGWLSTSGLTVFYGMLANDFYRFGTHVYLPVLGITGVVEDRIGSFDTWNHFDVWSPICYGTPTGWFRVAVQG